VEAVAKPKAAGDADRRLSLTLDETIERRVKDLTRSTSTPPMPSATARWSSACGRTRPTAFPGETSLAEAVARNLYKLMAYKDEYEVARLYTDGAFLARIAEQFEDFKLEFHLAPPLIAARDPRPGI
jgi:indolepyruvate ferredoxin oxidoreductase